MLNLTPFLKLYAKYRLKKINSSTPSVQQSGELLNLIQKAKNTKFGREHNFSSIKSVSDYQKVVPLRYYENFWNDYWKKEFPILNNVTWPGTIPYFPVSSGTSSGVTKYIPFTKEMEKSNVKAGMDLLVHHLNNKPNSKIFAGKNFILGGSTELVEQAPNIYSGDLSGIAVDLLPWWARLRYFPPKELALLKNWEEKISILSERSLKEDIRMISGVPSWMLIFFDHLFNKHPEAQRLIKNLYPDLEMLVHGGVNFSPYYEKFKELLKGSNAELREVYPASEGFIAVADRGYAEGLRLLLDNGIFFEFVPFSELNNKNPTRHWIENVEKNVNYAIVLTTCAGLWSYIIGDTVTFVDTETPRLLVTGRTSYYLSAFGEHLIADEIEDAMSYAAKNLNINISDYSVGAIYPSNPNELGGHLFVLEADRFLSKDEEVNFAKYLDERLCKRNEDYEAHRANGFGLKAPTLMQAKPNTFSNWMKKRGKLGGQNKVPRIITKDELLKDLIDFVKKF
jgi:hypothetical protein